MIPALRRVEGVVVAELTGDVDIANTAVVESAIRRGLEDDTPGLVLDLTSLRYLDSAGVRMLFDLARELERRGQAGAVVIDDESPVRKLLKITSVDEVMTLAESVEAAVDAVVRTTR